MKRNKIQLLGLCFTLIAGIFLLYACKKNFLDAQPYGQYGLDQVKNKKGVEGLLVGVYGDRKSVV